MFGMEKRHYWSLNLAHCQILEIGSHSSFNNYTTRPIRTRARDTATSMNMTVYLDTDPTYEDTTEKAVVVVLPLNALISDQMECRKSPKSGNSVHMSSVLWATFDHYSLKLEIPFRLFWRVLTTDVRQPWTNP